MRRSYFFDNAFLPGGWRRNVRLECADGLIAAVTPEALPHPGDLRERIAVPGMPNLHSHAFQRAMAGLTERHGPGQDNFWSWREAMYRFVSRMGPDEVEAIAAYAYADMLEAGFTTVGEFHYVHRAPDGGVYGDPAELALRHLAAAETTGLDITLLPVFYATSNFGGAPPTRGQRRFITDVETFAGILDRVRPLAPRLGVAPHSLRAVPPDLLREVLALQPDGPIHIHAAEQTKEVDDCIAWSGLRPMEWLFCNAEVDARWCLIHSTHLTPVETAALARSHAVAGLCPITEANLGDGIFPALEYLEAGGRFGIGTDSNVELNAAGELKQLEYSQRLIHRARNVLSSPQQHSTGRRLFEAALAGGSQALGLTTPGLVAGGRADFVVLDLEQTDLASAAQTDLFDTWIFSTGRRAVHKVAVGGQVVVEHGRHRAREAIDARYRAVVAKLLKDPAP